MFKFLANLFGTSKTEKDLKELTPLVNNVNSHFNNYQNLTNDELRNNTLIFKDKIAAYTQTINDTIAATTAQAEAEPDVYKKDAIFKQVDELLKQKNKLIEEVLLQILPEAFATIKEAARRFTTNEVVTSTATELDITLASKPHQGTYITINNGQSNYKNTWTAAGVPVTWNMVHYDVQLIGGSVLHQGKIAEMATGEGKTLVSTLPIYLNALAGQGVHLVTVNDYLAKRDSEWNGPLFEWLGLTVDCIDKHQPNGEARRKAYLADITYGTNNEFGFDYLRDNMVHTPQEMVQRRHHFAIVDEVDSVLIDDARTPLIISGPVQKGNEQEFDQFKPRIEKLINAQKDVVNKAFVEAKRLIAEGKDDKESGGLLLYRAYRGLPKYKALIKYLSEPGIKSTLQKTENYFLGEQQRNMPTVDKELYFHIDEKNNSVDLTAKGLNMITGATEDPNFFVLPDLATRVIEIENATTNTDERATAKQQLIQEYSIKADRIHTVQQLLKAYTLFEKDVEYIVEEGKVKIVDEQTGRVLDGRRYSDGLHQAIEAKENVTVEDATQTFATITLQNYFRMYHKLGGMTGTAETEAKELWDIYKLDVVTIPTNKDIIRKDNDDLVYKTNREKYNAVIDEVKKLSAAGRPVLVGTTSVDLSDLLSRMLKVQGVEHNVLNAKQHQKEAFVVAEAGLPGKVTIATNMAGRGTDIKLGPGVKEAGGLAIVGTERHESRRVDRQLRGRSGRQGDPGSSQFFVSLEDQLMRLFGSERLSGLMDKMGHKEGEVIQHSMISKSIERAQKKVEENNFGIRKRLLEYDDVMNAQRDVIYKRRKNALFGDRLAIDIENAISDLANLTAYEFDNNRNFEEFKNEIIRRFAIEPSINEADFLKLDINTVADYLYTDMKAVYNNKAKMLEEQTMPILKDIVNNNGQHIENVSIPFTDGVHGLNVVADMKDALVLGKYEVMNALNKAATLSMIDDAWKTHLRGMDELKQTVQMASYEQKDPLVIYKLEAYKLFTELITITNTNIVSFIFKASIPMQQQDIQEASEEKTDLSKMRSSHEVFGDEAEEQDQIYVEEKVKQEPARRLEPKIGRNEPCFCGSGKKYKACHGKML
jgi:preprotein translocase subunit SecA